MASINMSVKHGQPWDVAKAHFEEGISRASEKYGRYIGPVAWSDDRTEARLAGSGVDVLLWVDQDTVNARGSVPFFVKLMEGKIRKFVEESLSGPP